MSHFLLRILKYFSIIFLVILILFYLLVLQNHTQIKNIANKKLANIHTIVIGDSHTAFSFDEESSNRKFVDLSIPGEPLNITNFKTEYLLNYNLLNNIDTIIIGLAPHNISLATSNQLEDRFIKTDFYNNYYPLLFLKDFYSLKNTSYILNFIKNSQVIIQKKEQHIFFLGVENRNLWRTFNITQDSIKKNLKCREFKNNSIDMDAILSLQKIITMLSNKNIKIYIVNTPEVKTAYDKIPQQIKSVYYKVVNEICIKNKNVSFCDFSSIQIPLTMFQDYEHLNLEGEKYFTPYFFNRINTGEFHN